MTDDRYRYEGSELFLFSKAKHWKRYYAQSLQPFIGSAVLEVGAGIGGTTQVLCARDHSRWVCLEPDEELAEQLHERIRIGELPIFCERRVGTLRSLTRSDRFDTILYIDVLEHIARDGEELERAVEYLNPGGNLVILSPAHQWLFSPFDRAVGHFRRYSCRSLLDLRPSGTRVVLARYLDSVGLLASLANQILLRKAEPTAAQIQFWDGYMVPCSQFFDPILRYKIGKTVVLIWQRS